MGVEQITRVVQDGLLASLYSLSQVLCSTMPVKAKLLECS